MPAAKAAFLALLFSALPVLCRANGGTAVGATPTAASGVADGNGENVGLPVLPSGVSPSARSAVQANLAVQPDLQEPRPAETAPKIGSGVYLRAESEVTAQWDSDLTDIQDFLGENSSPTNNVDPATFSYGLTAGYAFQNGWCAELGLEAGDDQKSALSDADISETLVLEEYSLRLGGAYTVPLGRRFLMGLRLRAGPSWLVGTYSATYEVPSLNGPTSGGGGYDLEGVTFGGELGLCLDWFVSRRFALEVETGPRIDVFNSVNGYDGNGEVTIRNPLKYSGGANAVFDDSGLYFKFDLVWFRVPPLPVAP